MTALLLSMFLSQSAVQPLPEPPEVTLFAQWAQRQLLSLNFNAGAFEVRQRERVFRIQDDDFAEAFSLVPEAHRMAVSAHEAFLSGQRFMIAGVVLSGVSLGGVLAASFLTASALFFPLIVGALIASGAGLVLALIAMPFMVTAQSKFLAALASHNHGVLDLRPPRPNAGGMTLVLP